MRAVLAAALSDLRTLKRRRDDAGVSLGVAYTTGLLEGLRVSGALTSAEALDWKGRIGHVEDTHDSPTPDDARPSSNAETSHALTDQQMSRVIAGPFESALFDGLFRVVALEVLADRIYVHWRIAPLPTLGAVSGVHDSTAFSRDLEGLDLDT